MPTSNLPTFRELLDRARAGDKDAANQLVSRYDEIVRFAVRRSIKNLPTTVDDMVQDVWVMLLSNERRDIGDVPSVVIRDEVNRIACRIRRHRERREKLLSLVNYNLEGMPSPASTPTTLAICREKWRGILDKLSEAERAFAGSWLEGMSTEEIAVSHRVSRRTVQRSMKALLQEIVK